MGAHTCPHGACRHACRGAGINIPHYPGTGARTQPAIDFPYAAARRAPFVACVRAHVWSARKVMVRLWVWLVGGGAWDQRKHTYRDMDDSVRLRALELLSPLLDDLALDQRSHHLKEGDLRDKTSISLECSLLGGLDS